MTEEKESATEEMTFYVHEIDLDFKYEDFGTGCVEKEVEVPIASVFLSFGWNELGRLTISFLSAISVSKSAHTYLIIGKKVALPKKYKVRHVASCNAYFYLNARKKESWLFAPLHLFRIVGKVVGDEE